MSKCKYCDEGYIPAVNVNGVVIHRCSSSITVARIQDETIIALDESVYNNGIEICKNAVKP